MCDSWPATGSSTTPSSVTLRAGADQVVAARRCASRRPPGGRPRTAGPGRPRPGARAAPACTNSSQPTSDDTGLPGSPKTSVAPADAERHRLARPHGDAPEDLLDPELRLDPPDEIVRADRDAARRDEHVELEPLLERATVRVLVVGDRVEPRDLRAGGGQLGAEHRCVRLVDLARAEARSRAHAARCRSRGPQRAVVERRRPLRRRRRQAPRSAQRRCGLRARRPPLRRPRHDRAHGCLLPWQQVVVARSCCLFRQQAHAGSTASAPSGTTPPVAIPIASPGSSARSAGAPAATRKTTGQRSRACPPSAAHSRPSPSCGTAAGRRPPSQAQRDTDPPHRRAAQVSAASGRTRASTAACASARERISSTGGIRYWCADPRSRSRQSRHLRSLMSSVEPTLIAGRYRLDERLGAGSISEVWAATDLELDRRVALKLLASDADPVRFEREARAIAALAHPNICAALRLRRDRRPAVHRSRVPAGRIARRAADVRQAGLPTPSPTRSPARSPPGSRMPTSAGSSTAT